MGIKDLERNMLGLNNENGEQFRYFVYQCSKEAFDLGDQEKDKIQSIGELQQRKEYIRSKFIESIGGLPSFDTPLNPEVTGVIQCNGYRIEKVIYQSRPNTFVTSNLYIPAGITTPRGAVLFVCGHSYGAKHDDVYQVVCQHLVHAGLVVLAVDPVGQGERLSYYDTALGDTTIGWGTYEHSFSGFQCLPLGDSIARYFLHDDMRGIDYLATRPEVDPEKIGVTGNSGGGLQTCMLMIADPRVAAAAPGTFLTSRRVNITAGIAQDAEQIWMGLTALGIDHEDILISMVPKPVLVLACKYDFFPIEGTRKTVERAGRFWEMHGRADNITLFEDEAMHDYTLPMARKAADFFVKHFSGDKVSIREEAIGAIEPTRLWCTASGQVRGEIENSRTVHDDNCERLEQLKCIRNGMCEEDRKNKAYMWLKEQVFYKRKCCELNPRHKEINRAMLESDLRALVSTWWAQEGLLNYGLTFRDYRYCRQELPVTIAIWEGGTKQILSHFDWIREECGRGRAVAVIDLTGIGNMQMCCEASLNHLDFKGVIHKFTTDLFCLNDSLAALRTYELIRFLDAIPAFPGLKNSDIRVYSCGRMGLYAQLAAFLDKRIQAIERVNPMLSFSEWVGALHYNNYDIMSVVLPGVLKYFDLPDLDKWLVKIYNVK